MAQSVRTPSDIAALLMVKKPKLALVEQAVIVAARPSGPMDGFKRPRLGALIREHIQFFRAHEQPIIEKSRDYYRGDFTSQRSLANGLDSAADEGWFTSKNIVFAIADTATTSLVPSNPRANARALNSASGPLAPLATGLMAWTFDENHMRRRTNLAIVDATLAGRGIFKTGWDQRKDRAVISTVDPVEVFLDLAVRDFDEMRYAIHAVPLPWSTFLARVQSGKYAPSATAHQKADGSWCVRDYQGQEITPDVSQTGTSSYQNSGMTQRYKHMLQQLLKAQQWITVYEVYDREKGTTLHYLMERDLVLLEEPATFFPLSPFNLSMNGEDVRGLPEVHLILPQQETINTLLTFLKQITWLQIPRILYNAGVITETDLHEALFSEAGSFIGIHAVNAEVIERFSNLFYSMPYPEHPEGVHKFLEMTEASAAFVSALADAERSQLVNARTATEVAVMNSIRQDRLSGRSLNVMEAIEDVADKALYLNSRYMKDAKLVEVAGDSPWAEVNLAQLRQMSTRFKMDAFSGIKMNPAAIAETLANLADAAINSGAVNGYKLWQTIMSGMGVPADNMIPQVEYLRKIAEQAEAEAAAAGAPTGGPMPGGPTGGPALPPDIMAALAAGGGAVGPEAQTGSPPVVADPGTPAEIA